ncbi:retrovirus-related pol polyprotein from transposon TNT 1-94 [Tanacetum coccineum]
MFIEFVIQNQFFSYSLEEFAQILDLPCEGACVFTDKWSLDELANGVPTDGPYQTNPPSPDDIILYIRINREGQVRHIRHEEEIDVHEYQILTREIVPTLKPLEEIIRENIYLGDTVIVKLKEQIKSLKGNVDDSKVKMDMDEIETLNIELEHRVTTLVAENEHLKQTYKQLYDSIKPKHDKVWVMSNPLKNELRDNLKEKLRYRRLLRTNQLIPEEALVLRDIVKHVKSLNYPQFTLESAFMVTKVIQDLLSHISRSCPSINNFGPQLVEVTPRKKDKKVRFAESLTSTENTKIDSTSNIVSNKHVLHSTGVRLSTSASGSQPSGNTRNDRILQTPSSNSKNKVEAHPRNVKSSLNKRNDTVKFNGSASVQNSKKQVNFDYVCVNSDDCMSSDNLCVSNSMNDVKFRAKSKKSKSKKDIWKPTGKVFTQIGYIWRPTGRPQIVLDLRKPLPSEHINGTEFVNQTLCKYYEKVGISHETSVARSPQQNGVVERQNRMLIEAARTMLIYAKAPLFLWAEAVATACYTQNRSMIRHRHGKTPYELLHDKPPDLSYLHVFGALCYPTNDSENLGKLQPKADIGIFIGYAPTKKAFRIYNRRTRRIIETIHVDFDELTAMASEHSSSGPALHEMTPVTISSGKDSCQTLLLQPDNVPAFEI